MTYDRINCHGAMVEVFDFAHRIWPFDLPLEKWPSFCGAGNGLGDRLVPEKAHGVCLSPACFQHDLDYAISPRVWAAFCAANYRFLRNSISLALAQSTTDKQLILSVLGSIRYFSAVSIFGWLNFQPTFAGGDPLDNIEVRERIKKLTDAEIKGAR